MRIIVKGCEGKEACWTFSDKKTVEEHIREKSVVEAIFRFFYNGGRNFITPYVTDYGVFISKNGKYLFYEVSYGSGIRLGTTLWGLTILEGTLLGDGEDLILLLRTSGLSYGGVSSDQLEEYFEKLKKEVCHG